MPDYDERVRFWVTGCGPVQNTTWTELGSSWVAVTVRC
jgi:hypothetical protein